MSIVRRLVLLVALVVTILPATGRTAESVVPGELSALQDGPHPYRLLVPAFAAPTSGWPVVVALHGCTQDSLDFAVGSRWPELAATENFIAVFPEQLSSANGMHCWNWFEPAQQQRDGIEPAAIVSIVETVAQRYEIDRDRVYVMGVSAGADLAAILGATHPDVFAAIAPFAGCAYATCADVSGALAYAAMGEHARVVPAFIAQGTADPLNNVAMGETLVRQQVGTADHADDGELNQSVTADPTHKVPAQEGGSGELCVRNESYPCVAGAAGWSSYPYNVTRYRSGDRVVVEAWLIGGLMHNYPGGRLQEENPRTTFVDPHGPDLTSAIWSFFERNPRQ